MIDLLANRLEVLCRQLGYSDRPGFFPSQGPASSIVMSHVLKQAFETTGIGAAFCLDPGYGSRCPVPIVYVATAGSDQEADDIHRDVWSQGVAPILLVVREHQVEVRYGGEAPEPTRIVSVSYDHVSGLLPGGLNDCRAAKLSSSLYWRDYDGRRSESVDARLVAGIESLSKAISGKEFGSVDVGIVVRMIGKLLYLYILIDRNIVDARWLRDAIRDAGLTHYGFADDAVVRARVDDAPTWSSDQLWAVFDALDATINGRVFDIGKEERAGIPEAAWKLVHRVIRNGSKIEKHGEQLAFFDVEFRILRTETISSIYEQFLKAEGGTTQADEGAFYTPPFLADYVLDQVEQVAPLDTLSSVLDPAAGSGVFVVAAYRRLLEANTPRNGWSLDNIGEARRLLEQNIFALDRNPQAIAVCRLSLYLTLLDYLPGVRIEDLSGSDNGEKFLPALTANVLVGDSIGTSPFGKRRFSHVLGNPPWTRSAGHKSRLNNSATTARAPEIARVDAEYRSAGLPVLHDRMSDRFVWETKVRYLDAAGVLGFVLPARTLVGRHADAFAKAVAQSFQLKVVSNLSHLRYGLFRGGRAPACVVIARNGQPDPLASVIVHRPQLTSLPAAPGPIWSLFIAETDKETFRVRDFTTGDNGWFAPLMLGVRDRSMRAALRSWASDGRTLSQFISRSGLGLKRGGSPKQTGIPDFTRPGDKSPLGCRAISQQELSKANGYFKALFAGGILLIPRNAKQFRFEPGPIAFKSTYVGIFTDRELPAEEKIRLEQGLRGLQAFLESQFCKYLIALFGAQYLIDKLRFEVGDLNGLPIPYDDIFDPRLVGLAGSKDATSAILEHMGASRQLVDAVEEYRDFNGGFADGQLPMDAFDEVRDPFYVKYRSALEENLKSGLPAELKYTVRVYPGGSSEEGVVSVAPRASDVLPPIFGEDSFISKGVFAASADGSAVFIKKSLARFAWTRAQAAEDARLVIERMVA